ncbi:MAG TPA: Ig-like domain repeat protein [Pyrinomonadaceae bacterium]|nr:Ig-like domain repeat protein [Pyrinomonadaceae bacterium]
MIKFSLFLTFVFCVIAMSLPAAYGQAETFGGNSRHDSTYFPQAQALNTIKWSANIDLHNDGALIHYGSPLVTTANTVITSVRTATDGFLVDAYDGATGVKKYTLTTDYVLPDHNWIPEYGSTIANGSFGKRLFYPGIGGTIFHVDNPDSNTPGSPVREVFYTTLAGYNANAAAFNSTVFISTPITADSSGNIYFGFRVQGSAPSPLNTTQGGYARIDPSGHGTYVLAGTAANDANITRPTHNLAPAISNDQATVYVVVKWATNSRYGYLLGLDSTTLATKYKIFLTDPRNGNPAAITEDGTASPMIAPDGDVFFGVLGNPNTNGSRGFLLHFNSSLTISKPPGAFGWDYTAGLVPATMVHNYFGPSNYLLFVKYNEYLAGDGNGVNRVAILDPNVTQIDSHSAVPGLVEMREVLTAIAPTPDPENFPSNPFAVKEWCINAPAVNPATGSVYFTSEDGRAYSWNLSTNSLNQAVTLNSGIGQPYVPTVIGPDGTIYTLNGGTLFALGSVPGVTVSITSSSPDLRDTVSGNSITFTAAVAGSAPTATGTVTFQDLTYNGTFPVTTTLATNVPLNASGQAVLTTSSLTAGGSFLGNHFITATYSGDANHASSSATFMQKVHANASTTQLAFSSNPSPPGQPITLTATVLGVPTNAGPPTGMVTFYDADTVLGQVALLNNVASITKSNFTNGNHSITATYASNTKFAASSATNTLSIVPTPPVIQLGGGSFMINENATFLNVLVTRTGDTSGTSSVAYATSDSAGSSNCGTINGNASSRCDYLTTGGTLQFAAGENSKNIKISIIDDNRAEGNETFTISLSNATSATLASPTTAPITITDDDNANGTTNPLDGAPFFVHQHYLDFLNREPDQSGFIFWTEQITGNANNNPAPCPNGDTNCVNTRRINVSNAFFFELEFQQTGSYVYRLYRAAFGNNQPIPNPNSSSLFPGENLKMPGYQVFSQDRAMVPGGANLAQAQLALANAFVQRPAFISKYQSSTTADQFVDAVLDTITSLGVSLAGERANLITLYNSLGRGGVMYRLADDNVSTNPINNRAFIDAEYNRAFVYTQYSGYLRRDSDIPGFVFWLNQVNSGPLRDTTKQHAMVCSFITSSEYQQRFSTVATHSNTECPQ